MFKIMTSKKDQSINILDKNDENYTIGDIITSKQRFYALFVMFKYFEKKIEGKKR